MNGKYAEREIISITIIINKTHDRSEPVEDGMNVYILQKLIKILQFNNKLTNFSENILVCIYIYIATEKLNNSILNNLL